MRTIKFRVWVFESDIKKGYMLDIYEKFEKDYNSDYYLVYEDFRDLEDGRSKHCIPLQFTGLHDKNGKEIYEGDINQFGYVIKYCKEKALFGEYGTRNGIDYDILMSYPIDSKSQIIKGNIYENPELLEKKFAD